MSRRSMVVALNVSVGLNTARAFAVIIYPPI
jgi:hypothetical protein